MTDALEVFQQHALLGMDLLRFVEAALASRLLRHDDFTGQCAGHEHGLAGIGLALGATADAASVMGKAGDLDLEWRLVDAGHGNARAGEARYCRRGAAIEPANVDLQR